MQRKYRIYSEEDKKMIFSDNFSYPYSFFLNDEGVVSCIRAENRYPTAIPPKDNLIPTMESTGIIDSKGKEMFESDIAVYKDPENEKASTGIGIILNWVGGFVVRWVKRPNDCQDEISPLALLCDGSFWTVIGNTKENEELKKIVK